MARMGRPPAEDPKVIPVKVRVGKEIDADMSIAARSLAKAAARYSV